MRVLRYPFQTVTRAFLLMPVLLLACHGLATEDHPSSLQIQPTAGDTHAALDFRDGSLLLTVAEQSDYQATATYFEVITFIDAVLKSAPHVRRVELGRTVEGRSLPLLIFADPPISTSQQALHSGKLVVFAFGNIHAGEVCGKEALLMLARELAAQPKHPLLQNLIVLLAPIYNADGNEHVSKDNRHGQVGPADGMGQRRNAQGLDLNRDWMKLEAPETRAMVRLFNEWDPGIIIDTHTTNGSFHRYTLTYASPMNPAGDEKVITFTRDTMLPSISRALEQGTGYQSFFYGNFDREHSRWSTYSSQPRFGTLYRGLRNKIAILSEAYAYAPYRDRVLCTKAFVQQILEYAAKHRAAIGKVLTGAQNRVVGAGVLPKDDDLVAIRSEIAAFDEKVRIEGFIERKEGERNVATETPTTYEVEHFGRFVPTVSVKRPFAYVFPPSHENVIKNLRSHGVQLGTLQKPVEASVEVYRIASVAYAEREFQGHRTAKVDVIVRREARTLPVGSIVVHTAQPLGTLAVYLLEPHSDDGLCTWNFFDDHLVENKDFPVIRVPGRVELKIKFLP